MNKIAVKIATSLKKRTNSISFLSGSDIPHWLQRLKMPRLPASLLPSLKKRQKTKTTFELLGAF